MAYFYIKRLAVTGKGKETSVVDFNAGLNIVCGPSNTGKSYIVECIDYIFGGSDIPIESSTGYDCVKMTVKTENGQVHLEREFNSNKLKVSSTDPLIESGDYGTRMGKLNANTDLWLKLIGIDERHQVIYKKTFEKKNLTWRFFLHMFLIKEERVIQRPSILLPKQNTAATGALSSLLYLITGEDFAEADPREEKKIRIAKKTAVADYIRNRLAHFAERKGELDKAVLAPADLQAQVEDIIDEIAGIEADIADAAQRNKSLLRQIFALNEQLTECNTLHNRYLALRSQYKSDIKRLTFIAEGEFHQADYPVSAKCPFCDGELPEQDSTELIEATRTELHKVNIQLQDLEVSETELINELAEIESKIAALNAEKQAVEGLLNNELRPKAAVLKQTLAEYRKNIEIQDEFEFISGMENSMKGELFAAESEDEESEVEFSVKSRFDRSILNEFDKHIEGVLRACKYDGLGSARLASGKFDVCVNEKEKSTFGKGYRAFLNTALALALLEYLAESGRYSPGLLLVDSPILSLKERVDDIASDSMKSALFRYMRDNQGNGQIIIVENDIPELDYGDDTNIIRFTKDITNGRYGFLNGVR